MCQLLGMNCNVPTDICFSFKGFRRRGGETDEHSDGWGIGFFEDKGCRMFLDYLPSVDSPIAELVQRYPIKSRNVIAHIRKATQGKLTLANTHPFQRELWGEYWLFAHNGNLTGLECNHSHYRPVGETDSEAAFCWLLNQLRQRFEHKPSPAALVEQIQQLFAQLATLGTFNCLLSNGEMLLAHCATNLYYVVRQTPFTHAHLIDEDVSVDFNQRTFPSDRAAIIATQPLTDNESWIQCEPGEFLLFIDGMRRAPEIGRASCRERV